MCGPHRRATGFIGSATAARLSAEGHQIVAAFLLEASKSCLSSDEQHAARADGYELTISIISTAL